MPTVWHHNAMCVGFTSWISFAYWLLWMVTIQNLPEKKVHTCTLVPIQQVEQPFNSARQTMLSCIDIVPWIEKAILCTQRCPHSINLCTNYIPECNIFLLGVTWHTALGMRLTKPSLRLSLLTLCQHLVSQYSVEHSRWLWPVGLLLIPVSETMCCLITLY